MSARHHTPATRAAAITDYKTSGDSMKAVAERHGISRSCLHAWIHGTPHNSTRDREWTDADLAYRGGWMPVGLIQRPLLPERRSA